MDIEYSQEQEIKNVDNYSRAHVILLGAGASRAAFPNGDSNGIKVPIMDELFDILDIDESSNPKGLGFEEYFSDLYEKNPTSVEVEYIESNLYNFFSKLELPEYPTIYDYLILSLRSKDVVATFNWDPFLWLAAQRNYEHTSLPHLIFLHGNVVIGYCNDCKIKGYKNRVCPKCGKDLSPSKLLYPIKKKNYTENLAIDGEWQTLQHYIEHAFMFTVFGYSAPKTDIEAIKLLKDAWGDKNKRSLEEIEFIHKDGKSEDDVIKPWDDFIHSHHYRTYDNFFNSWIAKHPRRSCEVLWQQLMEAKFVSENPVPKDCTLTELQNWYKELISYEV